MGEPAAHQHVIPAARIRALQWAVGTYCTVIGALMLVVPHQFASPAYDALNPRLSWWGAGFLLAGAALFGSAVLAPPRRILVAVHVFAAAALILIAGGFAAVAVWTGTIVYAVLGVGTAVAPLMPQAQPGTAAREREWFAVVMGLSAALNGVAILALPGQFASPLYAPMQSYLLLCGAWFLVGGLGLLAIQLGPSVPRPWIWVAYLVGGGAFLFFFWRVTVPMRTWTGLVYYGGFGTALVLFPWLGPLLDRLNPASLRTRLSLALAVAAALPIVLVIALDAAEDERSAAAEALSIQQALAVALARDVADYVELHRAAVIALARYPRLLELTREEQGALLQSALSAYPGAFSFATFDGRGNPIARSDALPPPAASGAAVFEDARRTNAPTVDVIISNVIRRPLVVLGAPIRDAEGRFIGLVVGGLEPVYLWEHLARIDTRAGLEVYLVDGIGRAIAHPDASLASGLSDLSGNPAVMALAGSSDFGSLTYISSAGERLAGYSHVPGLGWGVVVERTTATALADSRTSREIAFILMSVLMAAAAVGGIVASGWLTAPLEVLSHAVGRLGSGDTRARLPETSVTEIATLTSVFSAMRERLELRTAERDRAEADLRSLNATLEERVAARTAELEMAIKELEGFTYTVSHDLRTPLRAMDGFSRILLDEYAPQLTDEARGYLRRVRRNAIYMGQLVDDLLAFAHLGRRSVRKQPVALSALVRDVFEDLTRRQKESRAGLVIGDLGWCCADPTLLKLLFANLLDNAIKFTRDRKAPVIEVGARQQDGERVYFVRDNGIGFDMRYVNKLFGVFQRLHRLDEYEGTGVGLAIVQRVVHRHGGRLWAEGAVGHGATFLFTLGRESGD